LTPSRVEVGNYYGSKLEGETVVNKFILIVPIALPAAVISSSAPDARADDQQEISHLEHRVATVTNGDELMKYWDGLLDPGA
jgi:hypothetical protein